MATRRKARQSLVVNLHTREQAGLCLAVTVAQIQPGGLHAVPFLESLVLVDYPDPAGGQQRYVLFNADRAVGGIPRLTRWWLNPSATFRCCRSSAACKHQAHPPSPEGCQKHCCSRSAWPLRLGPAAVWVLSAWRRGGSADDHVVRPRRAVGSGSAIVSRLAYNW